MFYLNLETPINVLPELRSRRSRRVSIPLGDCYCVFCQTRDSEVNLKAAGSYHATKNKVNTSHMKVLQDKWMKWAMCLDGYSHVVTALSLGDLASNQLFFIINSVIQSFIMHIETRKKQNHPR